MPYLRALEMSVHDKMPYKSTATLLYFSLLQSPLTLQCYNIHHTTQNVKDKNSIEHTCSLKAEQLNI